MNPLCFVLMPFGMKKDPSGGPDIDFDAIYRMGILPAVQAAGMDPVRADAERTGGIIHKAMFERLMLCDFAVADLTTANANVFYELGVRHAVRPATTLAIFATHQKLPFDVSFLRAMPYTLGEGNRFSVEEATRLESALAQRLEELRALAREDAGADSPVFQLLADYKAPDIARLKTDTFREQVRYSASYKERLAEARERCEASEVEKIEQELEPFDQVEAGVLVDLFLSHRALSQWSKMVELYERLPLTLRRTVMMREQLGFALNRMGERRRALEVLEEVVQEQGPSSETCGLIGRVYKDLWLEVREAGKGKLAAGHLDRAIESYVRGFEADWRDAYPGVNAVTLLDIKGDEPSLEQKGRLLPVVRFAVMQRLKSSKPDYWDHASLLELAVLDSGRVAASRHLSDALSVQREKWEASSTANNLRLIQGARTGRGLDEPWLQEIIEALVEAGT
jgi:tetratricopeptide (TPR) repeat protein